MEQKRWQLVRVLVWAGILCGAAIFWIAAGAALLTWLR
jgi:hypothetical protein